MTIWEARSLAVKQLQKSQSESNGRLTFTTPSLDVDCLLGWVLGYSRSQVLSHNQDFLDRGEEESFFALVEKRCTGFPVAYILNEKEFYGFRFFVSPDVLIPKADTELLVEKALEIIEQNKGLGKKDFLFADVCTGSGCVFISVLKTYFNTHANCEQLMDVCCHVTDISEKALDVARKNTYSLLDSTQQNAISFFQGDLLDAVKSEVRYDLIVSNPPYVPKGIVDQLLLDGRGEPRIALDGDIGSEHSDDGLFIINRLARQTFKSLKNGGFFLVETGEYNAEETRALMQKYGFLDVQTFADLAGQMRVTIGRKP